MLTKILAIDDDKSFLDFLRKNLNGIGYNTNVVSNPNAALKEFKSSDYDCLLLDVRIPGVNGLELLEKSLMFNPTTPVVMVSGQSSIMIAVEALKKGAFDFIEKPIDVNKLHTTIKNAIDKNLLFKEREYLFSELQENYKIIGESKAIKEMLFKIDAIANTPAKVLIQGETGTGKELVAWSIHHKSNRRSKPYIKINCAAIPTELLESELFGYTKGAFTGAAESKEGKFMAANGGTLFLDEIGDMSLSLQAKILRVLEENEVDVLGKNVPEKIDVRIVCATNQNLEQQISKGKFRQDLFFRLNVANIYIPPLRNRREDILHLAYYFFKKFSQSYNKQIIKLSESAEDYLKNYDFPGNVRELKNIVEKIVIYSSSNNVWLSDIQKIISHKNGKESLNNDIECESFKDAKITFEKKYLITQLEKNNWNIAKTAENIGVDRSNLFKKIQNLGIEKMQ